jgi:uncharacterized protein (DUF2147 family)
MRKIIWMTAIVAVVACGLAFADDGDAIVGLWLTAPNEEDGNARVEISKEGGTYVGKIVWLEKPVYPPDDEEGMAGKEKMDRENPDPDLRNRPVKGLQIMSGFEYAGKNKWKKGTIYAPDDGKTYKCKVTLGDDGVLKVRGFIGFSMLGRTEEWTRFEAED